MIGIRGICVLAGAAMVAGCASSGLPLISSGDRYVMASDAPESYRLGAGDKVRLTVFNEPTLSGEFSVSGEGLLSLPLMGEVHAAGKTARVVAQDVTTRLAAGYVVTPRVSMEVVAYRPYFMLGEVVRPGRYPYATGMTALNAIATAEGFSPRAKRKEVLIRGPGEATEQRYRLTPDLRIQPGDTVRLPERYF